MLSCLSFIKGPYGGRGDRETHKTASPLHFKKKATQAMVAWRRREIVPKKWLLGSLSQLCARLSVRASANRWMETIKKVCFSRDEERRAARRARPAGVLPQLDSTQSMLTLIFSIPININRRRRRRRSRRRWGRINASTDLSLKHTRNKLYRNWLYSI